LGGFVDSAGTLAALKTKTPRNVRTDPPATSGFQILWKGHQAETQAKIVEVPKL
jgi:hypothetical protein